MQGSDIRLRGSCPRANRGGETDRDEDNYFARRHAFGADDNDSLTLQPRTLFFVWVTLTEHKWVTLGERRGWSHDLRAGVRRLRAEPWILFRHHLRTPPLA